MSENLTALASENLNPSLRSLLEDVQRGHIRVPRFQRPFVWTDTQRLELLRSIRDNMPIGSLLVWRTVKFNLAAFPTVGPHIIPAPPEQPPTTGWQYLLDGHQRVSTLLSLLLQPLSSSSFELPSDEDAIDWNIQYDLMNRDFVFARKTEKKGAARPLLPLWTLFDGRLVNKHMREMRKQAARERWTDENLSQWEEWADQLSYRFQQCRIPIVVMVTDDLELAARTFQRINSLGTPMAESHLVAALTWTKEFDLRERLDEMREDFPPGWREIDEGLFLQVCKGLSGLDMTKAGQAELVTKLKEDPTLLERAGAALARAADWLSTEAAVVRPEVLPYAFQAVLLAVEIDQSWEGKDLPTQPFLSWFWRTCWSEAFASATYRQVRQEQDRLRNVVDGGALVPWTTQQDLPEVIDFRSARVRLLTLRLAVRTSMVDLAGRPVDGRALLASHGREALVRLFPVPRKASPTLRRLLRGAGNRFLIDPEEQTALRERLKNGPDLPTDALDAHFVDEDALAALRGGDLETFISRRAAAMKEWDLAEWERETRVATAAAPA